MLTAGHNSNAYLSGRNLPTVEVMPYAEASAYDILWSDVVVVEEGALTGVMPEPLPAGAPKRERGASEPRRQAGKAAKAAAKPPRRRRPRRSRARPSRRPRPRPTEEATAKKSGGQAGQEGGAEEEEEGTK